jgi:hypothetical protein
MALTITRKTRTILLIILAVLVVGGGGFLIWRVTREETVAPEEGEAAVDPKCPDGGYWILDAPGDTFCVNGKMVDRGDVDPGCYIGYYDSNLGGNCWKKISTPSPTKYTLKYTAGTGGKISGSATQTVEKGKSGSKVTAVPNSGYRFSKWSDGNTSASRTDTNVQRNITVTAQFTAQKYTVTYNGNGGTCTPTSREITHGQTSAKPSCTRTGHSLTGFTKTSGSCGSLDSTTGAVTNVTCNLTIKATWAKNTYTVTYDANGGTCEPTTRSVEYGNNSEAPTCTRSGYYVASFSRTGGSGGDLNTETGAISNVIGDQTIQVNWSKSCGDGTCAEDENAQNCPADCSASCGDGYCTHDETALSCPADCEASCGDGYCTHDENAENCPQDCDENCGDGICTGDENAQNCPADCESECGDGYCTAGEDSDNCPEDCGEPVAQGDTVPETGILDTVLGRISLGLSFIFLGGLVSQYSRINYFFNSISEKREFRKEIQKEKRAKRRQEKSYQRAEKRREKLEDRFK